MENGNDNKNKPAFPWASSGAEGFIGQAGMNEGMTMREYYAGLAMQGILAGMYADENVDDVHVDFCAKKSIQYADELLHQLSLSEGKKGE